MSTDTIYRELVHKTFEFFEINDVDLLIERILFDTRTFLNADAGTIYTVDGNNLIFRYAQNDSLGKEGVVKYKKLKIPIDNTSIAGYCANNGVFIKIDDVYKLPDNLPYRFNKEFDKKFGYRTKSMLVAPLKSFDGKVIGVIQIINKLSPTGKVVSFSDIDKDVIIKHFSIQASHALGRAIQTREMLMKMIEMARLRDPKETGAHVHRVGAYAVELYERWAVKKGLSPDKILFNKDILKVSAMLHDVGKVAIPDSILKKPGKLTEEEFNKMKLHTVYGALLFKNVSNPFEEACRDVALNHHERWDGKGYPGKVDVENFTPENLKKYPPKKGEEIPLFGRIVAIADVFDALISKRSYKDPFPFEKVVKIIEEGAGSQFDPELVKCFLEAKEDFRKIREYYED